MNVSVFDVWLRVQKRQDRALNEVLGRLASAAETARKALHRCYLGVLSSRHRRQVVGEIHDYFS